jgi:CheY-like chemotaxis protein
LGDISQLQQMFFSMLESFGDAKAIQINASKATFDEMALHNMGSDCNGGEYVCIDMVSGKGAQLEDGSQLEFRSVCSLIASCMPLRLPLANLMSWLGVLWYHDGELMIGETPDGGLCIRLLLGMNQALSEEAKETILGGNETILLVDDEGMIWDVVMDTLMNLGYTVILAANGRDAVETYSANPGGFDLVIMDMVMPEMNGREAFECLKRLDPNVKVLMSSGYLLDEDAHYMMEAGAVGFLRKPYKLTDLAKMVRELLDR